MICSTFYSFFMSNNAALSKCCLKPLEHKNNIMLKSEDNCCILPKNVDFNY